MVPSIGMRPLIEQVEPASGTPGGGSAPAMRTIQRDVDLSGGRRPDGGRLLQAAHVGRGRALPFLPAIQQAFGRHDVRGVTAHTKARAKGAEAFASATTSRLPARPRGTPSAPEAAHVVQQRAGIAVGAAGDTYERHAEAVAYRVVHGASAEAALDELVPSNGAGGARRPQAPPPVPPTAPQTHKRRSPPQVLQRARPRAPPK